MQALPDELSPAEDVVDEFLRAFHSDLKGTLQNIPWYLRRIIQSKAWEQKPAKDGRLFTSFEAWVQDRGYYGLRSTVEHLLTLCKEAPDVQAMIRAEVGAAAEHGANQHYDGVRNAKSSKSSDTATYLLRRLKRDDPALAERVVRGEVSAHAAAVEAGIRKPTWTAPDDPQRLADRIRERYPGWQMVKTN